MKKVLFITNLASPYRVRFFDELAKDLEVTVVYTDQAQEHRDREKAWFEKSQGRFREVQLKKQGKICSDVLEFIRQPFDEIVLCGYSTPTFMVAIAYMKVKKIPFCLEADGGLVRPESGLKFWFKKLLVSSAATYLSSGKETTDFFCHYGAPRHRVYEYPFTSLAAADILPQVPSREEKAALRRKLDIREEKVVLAIGQFIPRKGFDVLMKAAVSLDKTLGICIVGGQPTQEYLAMQKQLGLDNVYFVGFQKKEVLSQYYRAADLFVLPTREDIWGLVINEAMAYGLPVITTDKCVAGLELIRDGESGYIVPVEDAAALGEKITAVLEGDPRKMGAAALEAVRPYTIENMAKAHVAYFNR